MPVRHIQIDAFPLVRYNVFLGCQPRLLYLIDQQPLDRFPLCMGIDKMTGFPSFVSFTWLPRCPSFVHPARSNACTTLSGLR